MTSPNTPAQELIERMKKLLPVSWDNELDGHGEPIHAVLTFGDHSTQAITLCPDDWMALNEIPDLLLSNSIELERYREALKPFAEEAKNWLGVASETEVGLCTDPQVDLSLSKIVAGDFHRALAVIEGGSPITDPRDAEIEWLREALVAVDKMLFLATTFTDEARLRFAVESAHGISSAALKDKD
jgi:hypothetical protein